MPVVASNGGARADLVPHRAICPLLADPCLILEPDFQRLAGRVRRQGGGYEGWKVFLKTSCAASGHVRQGGEKFGVTEAAVSHSAAVASWVGVASSSGGVSSAIASVCMYRC